MRVSELRVLQVRFRKQTLRKPREFTSEKGRVRRRKEGLEEGRKGKKKSVCSQSLDSFSL